MTLADVLQELIECLGIHGDSFVGWDQVRAWPKGAIEIFLEAGWLNTAALSEEVECSGCEHNCFMPVRGQPADPYVACQLRVEMGKVKIPAERLQQWRITQAQVAGWLAAQLDLKTKPKKEAAGVTFQLGTIHGRERLAVLNLDFSNPVSLTTSGHSLPLAEVMFIENGQPAVDRARILAMVDLPPAPVRKVQRISRSQQERNAKTSHSAKFDVGTPEWRRQNAQHALDARYNKPGGSRDKQRQIQAIWRTSKYTSRDRCAEEECAGLDMSFAAARRALRNVSKDPASTK